MTRIDFLLSFFQTSTLPNNFSKFLRHKIKRCFLSGSITLDKIMAHALPMLQKIWKTIK